MEESLFKGKTGLRRLINAVGYSLSGFASAYRHEEAFRQEVLFAAVMVPLALWFDVTGVERAMMIACVFGVLIVELLNSAVEAAVDRISENHRLAKRAKDIGSAAAVFLSLALTAVVWASILLDRLG